MKKDTWLLRHSTKGIPVALDGRDMLGIAQTGTGKDGGVRHSDPAAFEQWDAGRATDVPRRNRRGRNHGREYGVRPIRA